MKKLLFIALIGLTVISCKKEDEETPTPPAPASIEGNWTTTAQFDIITYSGDIPSVDEDDMIEVDNDGNIIYEILDTTITLTDTIDQDDFDPQSIEILPNGIAYFKYTDDDGEIDSDTVTYEHTGNNISFTLEDGEDDGSDITFTFSIESLTSTNLNLQSSMTFLATDFLDFPDDVNPEDLDLDITYTMNWSLSK